MHKGGLKNPFISFHFNSLILVLYTFFNNNTPHGEQRWTVLIRQLGHTFQWQHATQWATPELF